MDFTCQYHSLLQNRAFFLFIFFKLEHIILVLLGIYPMGPMYKVHNEQGSPIAALSGRIPD